MSTSNPDISALRDEVAARERLARAQDNLLAALVGDAAPAPVGFDPLRLAACARMLRARRLRQLVRFAGPDRADVMARLPEYVDTTPAPRLGGIVADFRGFLQWLGERQAMPGGLLERRRRIDQRYRRVAGGLRPRAAWDAWWRRGRRG